MKAIETHYKGYRFRSRLEARWAVFFDALRIPYEYEKQGYSLDGTAYLPDFWLPAQKCWVEIKGQEPNKQEDRLAYLLAKGSGCPVYIFFGDCCLNLDDAMGGEKQSAYAYTTEGSWDNYHVWCICTTCGTLGIEYTGRSDRLPCKECYQCAVRRDQSRRSQSSALSEKTTHCQGKCPRCYGGNLDRGHTYDHPLIMAAYIAARSARFEHGETP